MHSGNTLLPSRRRAAHGFHGQCWRCRFETTLSICRSAVRSQLHDVELHLSSGSLSAPDALRATGSSDLRGWPGGFQRRTVCRRVTAPKTETRPGSFEVDMHAGAARGRPDSRPQVVMRMCKVSPTASTAGCGLRAAAAVEDSGMDHGECICPMEAHCNIGFAACTFTNLLSAGVRSLGAVQRALGAFPWAQLGKS